MQIINIKLPKNEALWDFEEEFFSELSYAFSARLRNKYSGVSEDNNSSEYSSDSDDENVSPTKRQKPLVRDSDMESDQETEVDGEGSTCVPVVTLERDNKCYRNNNFWPAKIKSCLPQALLSAKIV